MTVEEFIISSAEPLQTAFINLLSYLAYDLEKIFGLLGLFIVGLFVARWGRGIIARILKKILANKKLQEITKLSPDTLKDPKGWNSLIYNIPDLFRVLILVLIVSVALDLLEFEQASGIVGQIFAFLPNLIAVVFLLWGGSWFHNLGKEWFENAENTVFKGDTKIAKYGFYVLLWGIIISISLTQIGIGDDIIPIIVGTVGASVTLILGYGLKDEIRGRITVESLKQQGVEVGNTIILKRHYDSGRESTEKQFEILSFGFTHIKLKDSTDGAITFVKNSIWVDNFVIKEEKSK